MGQYSNLNSMRVANCKARRKIVLVDCCGGKCNICGYSRSIKALEFHHIDPQTKSFGLTQDGRSRSKELQIQQIRKCILVCANCHREIHDGLYTKEELLQYRVFNEQAINELLYPQKQIWYCVDCNKKITSGHVRCPECSSKNQRTVERPNRNQLKELIRSTPFTTIATMYKVSDKAIVKWCIAENLPSKKKEIKAYNNDEWEKI